jgi:hypothetical protein
MHQVVYGEPFLREVRQFDFTFMQFCGYINWIYVPN